MLARFAADEYQGLIDPQQYMILLVGFAFLAGIVTVLSPCILPVLPIILSSSVDTTGKRRPTGVVVGFVLSFTFFTLFLSTIVSISGIPADSLRFFSILVLFLFGLSLFLPQLQVFMEQLMSKLTRFAPNSQTKHGFGGGFLIGLSLGLLWTPCVGPILASVISLAITGTVTAEAFFITLAYSLGTALPMFLIMQAGSNALQKVPWLLHNSAKVQKAFGVVMVVTAIGIFFNIDRQFQTYILQTFPNYGIGLTKFEDNETVKSQLKNINDEEVEDQSLGKPMSDLQAKGPLAPEIIPGGEWFNTDPLTLRELRGKVVIVDFWTYSCINCQRTLPYLKDWYSKYKDKGLVIIGVHAPEFAFEKDAKNVAQAIKDFEITYPVVQDNDFATWRAYSNQYWPAKYFIDKNGEVRYKHFGEGAYDESEQVIQNLLAETGATNVTKEIRNPVYTNSARTPETYLGYGRVEYFASSEPIKKDVLQTYTFPPNLPSDSFAFSGDWQVMEEYAAPEKDSRLRINFEAKEVYLVMRTSGKTSQVIVTLDNRQQQTITITKDSLYKLISLPTAGRHILELKFLDDKIELFAFTFG